MKIKKYGAMCGGIISESENIKAKKRNIWANMMSFVMPDKQYKKYIVLLKKDKDKKATKLFEKYAYSQI